MQEEERNKLLDENVLGHHLLIVKIRRSKRWTRRAVNIEERYEIKVR